MFRYTCLILFFTLVAVLNTAFAQYYQLTPNVGGINWTEQVVRATGYGSPNPNMPPGSRRAGAIEAAKATARKNMMQVVKGINLDSKSTIENLISKDETLETQINGVVRSFRIIDTRYIQAGAIEVDVEVSLSSLYEILPKDEEKSKLPQIQHQQDQLSTQPHQQPALNSNSLGQPNSLLPSTEPGSFNNLNIPNNQNILQASVYTGLIIDARGLDARPALSPVILNESGYEIYSADFVQPQLVSRSGVVVYEKGIERAHQSTKVSDSPLVVTAIGTTGANKADIIISNDDANRIQQSNANSNFLTKGNVLIVLD